MAQFQYDREVRFDEFRQRVRRHSPSTLLPVVASRAREQVPRRSWYQGYRIETPWALAAAARVSLLYGDERRSSASATDLRSICAAFASLKTLRRNAAPEAFRAFFLRMVYEQLPYQADTGYDVARSVAMFRDSLAAIAPAVLTPEALTTALGGTVTEFVGTGWLLFASAMNNDGRFLDEWIEGPGFRDVVADLPASTLRTLIERAFAADIATQRSDGLARAGHDTREPERERYAYNPLANRPLVMLQAGRYLIPSPLLLLRRFTTTGIYYAAMEALGPAIGGDLGAVFEHYTGRQFGLVHGARLIPEITYGKPEQRTVDWFVVFDDLLLLVEVKAPRLTEAARLGDTALANDLERTIGKARRQIDRTAALVANEQADLLSAGVPSDLPVRGIIVTLEPYHLVQSPLIEGMLPPVATPTTVASIHDLEHMVALTTGGVAFAEQLRRIQDDPELSTWSALAAVRHAWPGRTGTNAILEAANMELPWRDRRSSDTVNTE